MGVKVVELPTNSLADVAGGLRRIADQIELGEFGDAHNVAWVIDTGGGRIEVGMLGKAPEPASLTHFLLALGQRRLEQGGLAP